MPDIAAILQLSLKDSTTDPVSVDKEQN